MRVHKARHDQFVAVVRGGRAGWRVDLIRRTNGADMPVFDQNCAVGVMAYGLVERHVERVGGKTEGLAEEKMCVAHDWVDTGAAGERKLRLRLPLYGMLGYVAATQSERHSDEQ